MRTKPMILTTALGFAGVVLAAQGTAQVTFYEYERFRGETFAASGAVRNFDRTGFNDRASSAIVERGHWEVCENARFSAPCVVLGPGSYPSLAEVGLNNRVSSVRPVASDTRYPHAPPPVERLTFYEYEDFRGEAFTAGGVVPNFQRHGFNDRASSAVVDGGQWEVCTDAQFAGRCVTLRPGSYRSLAELGMNHRISSVRPVTPQARYEYAPRPGERLHQVNVASVRAVVGPPEQRCWVEREHVTEPSRGEPNVAGAIVGGIIGGVLGHQIGGGRGRDVATAGGAVAGAAIGANAGRGTGATTTRDVQRCAAVPDSARPEYWDVTYFFRGIEHRVQLSAPPGATIWVNDEGQPRG